MRNPPFDETKFNFSRSSACFAKGLFRCALSCALLSIALPARAQARDAPAKQDATPLPPLPPPPPEPPAPPATAPPVADATDPEPPPTVAPGIPVHLSSSQSNMTFHLRTEDGGFSLLCVAPCDLSLSKGKQRLAVSQGGGEPVESNLFDLRGPSRLDATYKSRYGVRIAGVVTFFGSTIAGIAIALAGRTGPTTCDEDGSNCSQSVSTGAGVAALSVAFVGGTTGALLALLASDGVEISVVPLSPVLPVAHASNTLPLLAHGERSSAADADAWGSSGLSLRVRF
ncbi:MAG TPA: hypothetical protein VNO21_26480 [Polyangiaceae bacterium]|nr:hypothetical protein [Polyangiaceae bacterium]